MESRRQVTFSGAILWNEKLVFFNCRFLEVPCIILQKGVSGEKLGEKLEF